MTDNVVPLMLGSRILTADGYAVVVQLERHGVRLRFSTGPERSIAYSQLDVRSVGEDGIQADGREQKRRKPEDTEQKRAKSWPGQGTRKQVRKRQHAHEPRHCGRRGGIPHT